MYEFWYDYVKLKYGDKEKLCYMDTDSLIVYIKPMIFTKILQKILNLNLIFEIMNQIDRQKKKIKKSNWIKEI